MKKTIKAFFDNEILSYLFLVVLLLWFLFHHVWLFTISATRNSLATALANIIGILFAFLTNDTIVFKQVRRNWPTRLAKFFLARLYSWTGPSFNLYLCYNLS